MASFSTEAKVGVFVLLGLSIFVYMSYRVGGFDLARDKGYEIEAVFDSAAGLKVDGPVQIAGINIGKIKKISLDGARAKLTLQLNKDIVLPLDSRAMIRTQGVLGDKFVEIVPGTAEGPRVEAGGRLTHTAAQVDFDQIINQVGQLAGDIRKITATLGDVIGTAEGGGDLKRTITNFGELSENLAKLTRENQNQVNEMIKNLTVFSADLRSMSSANKENINAILSTFRHTSDNMSKTIAALQSITNKINRGEGSLGALVNDQTTVNELNSTLSSLKDISNKINTGQGTIGKLVNESGTATRLDDALTGINNYLAKQDAFKIYVDYHGEYMFRTNYIKSLFDLRIQPADDKFYLLGVVSDKYGGYTRTDRVYTSGGVTTTTTEDKYERNEYKFNAQIAKRFHDLVIRAGLFESQAGVGFDYHFLNDNLKFTFEASTGDLNQRARLKGAATYTLWKVFYATAGYEDFISNRGRSTPFVGLGIKFNDDDIKHVLSTLPSVK